MDAESGSQVTLAGSAQANSMARPSKEKDSAAALIKNTSVFTWRDLKYTVKVPGGERLLLDSISGYVKPGQLGALMGSSGAGGCSFAQARHRVTQTTADDAYDDSFRRQNDSLRFVPRLASIR